ncbi:MBL fold metallo-hydrolase [Paenibacillus barcinonensis]|uniref:L-ascorbate metabolism protein UlaG (Beta-lactamase superfamily) n=1 Tax=Paenibacillus barcinonensis TaxID=198119 RepID=A0A2V4VU37_PAEBA|nr:MBL fold metallo-hydrolase [Paenibacillus barcinonensis]PYE50310.1 L-ascorbate metabolism protein UlaG (beta-lactamase superfamily) [Paenibacillus barcinonensis]QKS54989.1 MBL fold metallo-hydrolase [Paenibacillus barcinonensis]
MTKYENQIPTSAGMSIKSLTSILRDSLRKNVERRPSGSIPVERYSHPITSEASKHPQVTWFGHSAFLLEIEAHRLLFDPMLGERPSPVSWAGTKRFSRELPMQPEDFPELDAIVISHDHYDHLDVSSIRRLKNKTKRFIVPLGVRKRLIKWGVPADQITEHQWGDEFTFKGLTFACTPARHFSGRGLLDRDSTLWCSWAIIGEETKVFFSGDSGYGPHFKEIGSKYGPFDLTLMECGQYDKRWSNIHMMPEETVQAHLDVGGELLIPIHWGAFTLAYHAWNEPAERVTRAARTAHVRIATPKIGETVVVNAQGITTRPWWR